MNAALTANPSIYNLICVVDADGKFVEVNERFKPILGYDANEMLGHVFTEFVHPDFVQLSTAAKDLILKRGYISHFSNSYVSKEGKVVLIDWSAEKIDNLIRCTGRPVENEEETLLYQLTFRENPTAMLLYDPQTLDVLNVNQAACELYGYTEEEFLKKRVITIKPPTTDEKKFTSLIKEYVKKQISELPDLHVKSNGALMDVVVWGKTIALRNRIVRLISVKDITEIKKNEAQLKLFAAVMTNVADSVLITDMSGRILYINPAFEKVSEYSAAEVLYKHPTDFLLGEDSDTKQIKKLQRNIALGEPYAGELIHYTKSGKRFWVSMSIAPVRNEEGEAEYFISVMRDITSLRRSDEEKKALAQDLLRSSTELKQFSYITAHNFRAPLSNMMAILQLVEQSQMSEEDKRWLKLLKSSAMQLNDTINDLVNILIVRESAKVEKTLMDVRPVIDRVLNNYGTQLKEINATIHTSLNVPFVRFHPVYLSTIADQLINNAVKFRSAERPLQIRIHSTAGEGYTAIVFSDNGLGADASLIEGRIFGLYQRFHENVEGKGLGLFAVKAEAEALDARVEVRTNTDAGFEIRLLIPD